MVFSNDVVLSPTVTADVTVDRPMDFHDHGSFKFVIVPDRKPPIAVRRGDRHGSAIVREVDELAFIWAARHVDGKVVGLPLVIERLLQRPIEVRADNELIPVLKTPLFELLRKAS